jgi:hypothetical protein
VRRTLGCVVRQGALAVYATFNVEQGVDALDRFEGDWRDRRRLLAASGIGSSMVASVTEEKLLSGSLPRS